MKILMQLLESMAGKDHHPFFPTEKEQCVIHNAFPQFFQAMGGMSFDKNA